MWPIEAEKKEEEEEEEEKEKEEKEGKIAAHTSGSTFPSRLV